MSEVSTVAPHQMRKPAVRPGSAYVIGNAFHFQQLRHLPWHGFIARK